MATLLSRICGLSILVRLYQHQFNCILFNFFKSIRTQVLNSLTKISGFNVVDRLVVKTDSSEVGGPAVRVKTGSSKAKIRLVKSKTKINQSRPRLAKGDIKMKQSVTAV